MCSLKTLGYWEKPSKIFKTDSSAVVLKTKASQPLWVDLLDKQCPHTQIFRINLSEHGSYFDERNEGSSFHIPGYSGQNTWEFLLTWYNDKICFGELYELPYFEYPVKPIDEKKNRKLIIGFVRCEPLSNNIPFEFDVLCSADMYIPMEIKLPKKIDGGDLRWVKMKKGDELPIDAMIGGFEDEPLYIARANHMGSLCPGKYVKSKQCAFVPWGYREHSKTEFEILCGYDALWVRCVKDMVPENAFVAGRSEVQNEPLYIGRVWAQDYLIPGKVHRKYSSCYVPLNGVELENQNYEILVTSQKTHGRFLKSPCYMQMNMQACV